MNFLILISLAFSSSLIEDIIDLAAAAPSLGIYLQVREMSEAELAAEIDKRLATKQLQIAKGTNARLSEMYKEQIAQDLKAKAQAEDMRTQLYTAIQKLKTINTKLGQIYNNMVQVQESYKILIASLKESGATLHTLSDLYQHVLQIPFEGSENPALSNIEHAMRIIQERSLNDEHVLKSLEIIVAASTPQAFEAYWKQVFQSGAQLSHIYAQMEANIKKFEAQIQVKEKALAEL